MSSYSFSDVAVRDLDEICDRIAQVNAKAASELFEAIRQKCRLVAGFPNMGKSYNKLAPGLRGFIVKDYIILYYPRTDGIDVARVVSGYRDLELLFVGQ
jgi:toxin ParE1/3/4